MTCRYCRMNEWMNMKSNNFPPPGIQPYNHSSSVSRTSTDMFTMGSSSLSKNDLLSTNSSAVYNFIIYSLDEFRASANGCQRNVFICVQVTFLSLNWGIPWGWVTNGIRTPPPSTPILLSATNQSTLVPVSRQISCQRSLLLSFPRWCSWQGGSHTSTKHKSCMTTLVWYITHESYSPAFIHQYEFRGKFLTTATGISVKGLMSANRTKWIRTSRKLQHIHGDEDSSPGLLGCVVL